jgi:multicomponent Na+:H+ antiporter subunit E
MFALNLMLMVAWIVLTGNYSPAHFIFGFALGYAVLWLLQSRLVRERYFSHMRVGFGLFVYFLSELFVSNVKVVVEVLRPGFTMKPAILAIPLDLKNEHAITLLANMITLTPGTLSVDISDDHRVLYMHTMYADDAEEAKRKIKNGFERRLREIYET